MPIKRNDPVEWIAKPLRCSGVDVKPGDILTVVNEIPGRVTGCIMLRQDSGPCKGISFFALPSEVNEVEFL